MTNVSTRIDAHLDAVKRGRHVLATAMRDDRTTARSNTVARVLRVWVVITLAACGGHRGDTYARATQAQEQCCEVLSGATRDECLARLVRVHDPELARADANQDHYACVQEHFVCDPTTGHATQPSAQAQLDCIQDLDESRN